MPTLVNNLRAIRGPITSVPVVGVSGVVVEPDTANNQVVVRADETVLFEDPLGHQMNTDIVLPEDLSNFQSFKVYYTVWGLDSALRVLEFFIDANGNCMCSNLEQFSDGDLKAIAWRFSVITSSNKRTISLGTFLYYDRTFTATDLSSNKAVFRVYKIVGINRIANA